MFDVRGGRWTVEQSDPRELRMRAVEEVVYAARSPIQHLEIVRTAKYGRMLLLDGLIQSAEHDQHLYHEALVLPAMLCHPDPGSVLILGGGEGATLRQVLNHRSVRRAVMVDIDQLVVQVCREYLTDWHCGALDDPRAELVIDDGRTFLERTSERFDVIISDVTDFLERGPALRLFTREFFAVARQRLRPGGVLVLQALEFTTAVFDEHVALHRTLATLFARVRSYVGYVPSFDGTWAFLTASETLDPAALVEAEVDARIARALVEPPRAYDGEMQRGLMALPKDLRGLLRTPGPILHDTEIFDF